MSFILKLSPETVQSWLTDREIFEKYMRTMYTFNSRAKRSEKEKTSDIEQSTSESAKPLDSSSHDGTTSSTHPAPSEHSQDNNNTLKTAKPLNQSSNKDSTPFNKCENLQEHSQDNKTTDKPTKTQENSEDSVTHKPSSLEEQRTKGEEDYQPPRILLLGTHRDLKHLCAETVEQKNQILESIIPEKLKKQVIYREKKKPIFELNGLTPDDDDVKMAESLRSCIMKECPSRREKTPWRWHIFNQKMRSIARRLKRNVLSREEHRSSIEEECVEPRGVSEDRCVCGSGQGVVPACSGVLPQSEHDLLLSQDSSQCGVCGSTGTPGQSIRTGAVRV